VKRVFVILLAGLFLVPIVIPSGASAGSGTFTDIAGNTHAEAIQAIADADITKGCTATTYCPADLVTRAQMASFLARAFELPPAPRDYFRDDAGSVHEDNINRIAYAEITLGVSKGMYDPGGNVTRAQMASFLARALGLDPVSGNRFTDVDGTHAGNINAIAEEGITLGCNAAGTRYCPTDPVRRDQMASFLARALDLVDTEVLDRPAIERPGVIPETGRWAGTTSQGREITFTVERSNGYQVASGLRLGAYYPGCPSVTQELMQPIPIVDGRFGNDSVTGVFTSPTRADGTFSIRYPWWDGWMMRDCTPSGTWTASR
jgi:hypothetical protein